MCFQHVDQLVRGQFLHASVKHHAHSVAPLYLYIVICRDDSGYVAEQVQQVGLAFPQSHGIHDVASWLPRDQFLADENFLQVYGVRYLLVFRFLGQSLGGKHQQRHEYDDGMFSHKMIIVLYVDILCSFYTSWFDFEGKVKSKIDNSRNLRFTKQFKINRGVYMSV